MSTVRTIIFCVSLLLLRLIPFVDGVVLGWFLSSVSFRLAPSLSVVHLPTLKSNIHAYMCRGGRGTRRWLLTSSHVAGSACGYCHPQCRYVPSDPNKL